MVYNNVLMFTIVHEEFIIHKKRGLCNNLHKCINVLIISIAMTNYVPIVAS